MSEYSQTYSTKVAGSAADCFAVLTDFEAYPRWSSPIKECRVLERYPDGLARRVEFFLDMTIKTIRYVLEYTYEAPHTGRWRLVEGDLRDIEGVYRFEETKDGTIATCTQAIDIGFWIPGFLRGAFERSALRTSVEEFKKAVEARRS